MEMNVSKNHHIYIFDCNENSYQQNSLKEFIYYLKFTGKRGVIDFSYAAASESIHPELTIKENFILDSVPTSLIKNKEDNLNQTISELHNKFLTELIDDLKCINRKTKELTSCEKKLCSIVKTLLSKSEYIFLENPDQGLDQQTLKKVKKCLIYEVEHHNRIVFINSKTQHAWLDIATDIISKDENKNFIKKINPLNIKQSPVIKIERKTLKKEPTKNIYNFSLMKKVS